MNVLMLSMVKTIITNPLGDVIERHVQYAKSAGATIHLVTYTPHTAQKGPKIFDSSFIVYPTNSLLPIFFPLDAFVIAARLCKQIKFDLIYSQDPFLTACVGYLLKKRFGIPLIIGNHSSFLDNEYWIAERPFFFRMLNSLAHFLIPKANYWRVVNEGEKEKYVKNLRLPAEKIYVFNTPITLTKFSVPVAQDILEKKRTELKIPKENNVILWVGRPARVKRVEILLKSFELIANNMPATTLLLVGNKIHDQIGLANLIATHPFAKNIIWLDAGVSHDELPLFYQLADMYVHTSNYEGFGNTMAEASASGRPVVTTATAGGKTVVEDNETGFITEIDDYKNIAAKVLFLLSHNEIRQEMGQSAQARILGKFKPEYDLEKLVEMWSKAAHS